MFDKGVSYPAQCAYTISIPEGCVKVHMPRVTGLVETRRDGMPVRFKNGLTRYSASQDMKTGLRLKEEKQNGIFFLLEK